MIIIIPVTNDGLIQDFVIDPLPSHTFKIHTDSEMIAGFADSIEAVKQAIYLILNVERYEHLIYSWNYGAELSDLIGKPVSFCLPEIKRRITEALLQDDRINGVGNFTFEVNKGKIFAAFEVDTVFGAVHSERVVEF